MNCIIWEKVCILKYIHGEEERGDPNRVNPRNIEENCVKEKKSAEMKQEKIDMTRIHNKKVIKRWIGIYVRSVFGKKRKKDQ